VSSSSRLSDTDWLGPVRLLAAGAVLVLLTSLSGSVSLAAQTAAAGQAGKQPAAAATPAGQIEPGPNPPAASSSSSTQKSKPNYEAGSPRHIFFIIPAYSVEYLKNVPPLTPGEKFHEWAEGVYDPIALGSRAFEGLTEYSHVGGFCGYGAGVAGYAKCFGSAQLDADTSSFLGDFLFPTLLHQDPRYFRMGTGYSFGTRVFYAVSHVFITRSDAGNPIVDTSALMGSVIAAADSNLYYPKADRGLNLSLGRLGWDLGGTAVFNLEAEFWPDIKDFFSKRF
jgi:hypothetical protein